MIVLLVAACARPVTPLPDPTPGGETLGTVAPLDPSRFPTRPADEVSGRTLHVATTGDDSAAGSADAPLASIAEATRRAGPGDKVLVAAGTYAEHDPDSGAAFVVRGAVVAAAPGAEVVVVPGPGSLGYGVRLAGDRPALVGVTVRGFPVVGVELGDGGPLSGAALWKVAVEDCTEGIVAYGDLGGDPVVEGLLLDSVRVDGATVQGISCNVGPCRDWRLVDVRVSLVPGASESSGADAIAMESGANVLLERVETTGASADGIDLKVDGVAVLHAWVHDVSRNGLKLWRGGDVVNSLIERTGADAAVVFDGPGRYRLAHSAIVRHLDGQPGSYTMHVGYDLTCRDGRCCPARGACGELSVEIADSWFGWDSGPISVPGERYLTVRSSAFFGFAEGEVVEWRDVDRRLSAAEIGALDQDPRVGDDRRPLDGSPLVDAGLPLSPLPAVDLGGAPRVVGAAPDVGPFELQGR